MRRCRRRRHEQGVLEARAFDSTHDLQLGADPDERWAPGFAPAGCNGVIFELEEGPSGELYVGGKFTECGGVEVNNIARYEPAVGTWSALGSEGGNGVAERVRALAWVDGDLYVGGELLSANVGGDAGSVVPANRIARWDGAAWSAVGSGGGEGFSGASNSVAITGGRLYVGGALERANLGGEEVAARRLAAWDGAAWSSVEHRLVMSPVAAAVDYEEAGSWTIVQTWNNGLTGSSKLIGKNLTDKLTSSLGDSTTGVGQPGDIGPTPNYKFADTGRQVALQLAYQF